MRVLVTGGTGFVGSHIAASLVAAGHSVRLLVRTPARVAPTLAPLGVDADKVEVVTGDVTAPDQVAGAVAGCDAAVHAASVYSFDTRDRARIEQVNVGGTATVLKAALAAGADPVIQVSSVVALLPSAGGAPLDESSPVGTATETYMKSKAESDRVARELQADGAPVVITYPGQVLGPYDPHLGDGMVRLRNTLNGLMPMWPAGDVPLCDVRDVADLHAALLEPGKGPRRYIAPGHNISTRGYLETIRQVSGRRLPTLFLPAKLMLPVTLPVGLLQRVVPWHIPAEYGAVYIVACSTPIDDSRARREFGLTPRPLKVTLADSVAWLAEQGHLRGRS